MTIPTKETHRYVGMWRPPQDRKKHGTQTFGEKVKQSILKEKDVKYIRSKLKNKRKRDSLIPNLASKYGVNYYTIYKIYKRESWKYLH